MFSLVVGSYFHFHFFYIYIYVLYILYISRLPFPRTPPPRFHLRGAPSTISVCVCVRVHNNALRYAVTLMPFLYVYIYT